MRFHVLGLGPIGQLVAFHLRRNLSPKHAVTLMFKTEPLAKRVRDFPLHIEYDGVVSSTSGFDTEATLTNIFDTRASRRELQRAEAINTVSVGKRSRLMLPSRETRHSAELQKDRQSSDSHIDSLIVTCKAQSTLAAIRQVQHRLSPHSTITLLQNGNLAVHEQLLHKVFTKENERPHFILISNNHGAWLKHAPFQVVHAGVGQLRFGIVPDGRRDFEKTLCSKEDLQNKPRLSLNDIATPRDDPELSHYRSLRNTVAVLQKLLGLHPTWDTFADVQVLLRQKLVVNCVINPLTTLLGCRNGELCDNPSAQRLAYRICKEAAEVFRKEAIANAGPGIHPSRVYIPSELTVNSLMFECNRVAKLTAGNTSSMLADLKKGNKVTEIEFLNGHLLTLGTRFGHYMGVNASMVDLVMMRSELPLDTM